MNREQLISAGVFRHAPRHGFIWWGWAVHALCVLMISVSSAAADDAAPAALRARYAALKGELQHNAFNRPLHLQSTEGAGNISGEIFALVDQPFATASTSMNDPSEWCSILILHLNTKYCRPVTSREGTTLQVRIGKKFDQTIEQAYAVNFQFQLAAMTADYLNVQLAAAEGPLGTSNYRIAFEAVVADESHTFIHMSYSYSYGMLGRLAMQAYLATIGRNKVGFTVTGQDAAGAPLYMGGMRGVVERNAMRYFLAIEAFLGAASLAPDARMESSLQAWFSAIERYPRQLHEMEQGEYIAMKRKEIARQKPEAIVLGALAAINWTTPPRA
jgi:hypothetical protein